MALNDQYLNNDVGSIFVQVDGVGPTDISWLGCHDLGDVEKPFGDIERTYCPDPAGRGKWSIATRTQAPPGEVTFDIEMAIGRLADELEVAIDRRCALPVYAMFYECTARDQFAPFWRALVISDALAVSQTINAPVSRNADGGTPALITETFSFSAGDLFWAYALGQSRKTIVETESLLDIAQCSTPACAGICGGAEEACDAMITSAAAPGGLTATVSYSADGGQTWTASAADPFAADEDISSVVCFELDDGSVRWLAARGTTDGANPAEVAYSDDTGATWTTANVGSTNAEFVPWNGGLFALNGRNIWCCTDTGAGAAGNVYFSSDFGVTWTLQLAAAADALNAVKAVNERVIITVGDTNEIDVSTDGGATWTTITGPAAQAAADALSVVIFSNLRYYVGYDDGEVWMTTDGGATWTQCPAVVISGSTITAVNDMDAINEHVIYLAISTNDGADDYPAIARTITGGEQWEYWIGDTACGTGTGMNAVVACTVNHAFGVGCDITTGYIMEVTTV